MATSTERAGEAHLSEIADKKHIKASSPGQGACLFARCKEGIPATETYAGYEENNTCNYRWQAYLNTTEKLTDRFNWPSYRDFFEELYDHPRRQEAKPGSKKKDSLANLYKISIADLVPTSERGGKTAASYMRSQGRLSKAEFLQRVEQDKPWDLGKTFRSGEETFKRNAKVPYPFNSHHIIPSESFNDSLSDAAQTDEELYSLIRTSLLSAKYNVNYKENMVILPMLRRVGKAIQMPMHCAGSYNHPVYNDKATSALKKVFADYAQQIANRAHNERVPEFQKRRLIRISNQLLDMIKLYGAMEAGGDLDSMDDEYWSLLTAV